MGKLLKFFDPYIGLMALVVAIAAVFPAQGQGAVVAKYAANAGIVFLFFLYGTRLSPRAALDGILQWKLQLAVLLFTFALFPILGLALSPIFPASFPAALVTGFLFLCVLPSTVQSSIAFTSIARGNVAAALCAASASNMLGVFLSPLLAGSLLQAQGAGFSLTVFRDITLQLLAPFAAGQLMRPIVGGWVQRNKRILGYADRGSILLIIYVAFSKGMVDDIWTQLQLLDLFVLTVILCALLALILGLTMIIGLKAMRLSKEDDIVLQFCGSNKSLASGLPMSTVIFPGPQQSLIILPLMLFHQIQLIVCAILARKYSRRTEEVNDMQGAKSHTHEQESGKA
jgi:solute carrier family 10 (sodium/bile acid cotransporter), member 7